MEVKYSRARFSARMLGFLADLIIMFIFGLILVVSTHAILQNATFYKNASSRMKAVEIDSGLYIADTSGEAISLVEYYTVETDEDYGTVNEKLETALTNFYKNEKFFDDTNEGSKRYFDLKLKSELFIYKDVTHKELIPSLESSQKDLYKFYAQTLTEDARLFLTRNSDYSNAVRVLNWSFIGLVIVMPVVVSFTVFEYVIPMIFKKGRRTLGKLMFRTGLVDERGLSPKVGKFTIRFLLFLFIEVLLSLVTFGIPLIISVSLFFFSKNKQPFHDYMTGVHLVDIDGKRIFMTEDAYKQALEEAKQFELKKEDVHL